MITTQNKTINSQKELKYNRIYQIYKIILVK